MATKKTKKGAATKKNPKKTGMTKTAVKKVAKKTAPKKAVKKTSAKRTPNAAFMKAMRPSESLSKIVGANPLPRTEVTKKLWAYIKKNKLQDNLNKRNINADANLLKVFGGKQQVSMFEMTKLVNKHLS